jgi:hypothetical protein
MTLIAVDIVPVWIGLGFLAVIAVVSVAYLMHMRLLTRQVRRVQRERSLARAVSATAAGGTTQPPQSAEPLAPVLQFSAAQRHWAERLKLDRAVTTQDRDTRTIAHSAGA